jgi:RNA polymerase sigma-70 factor, ECF subfamily
VTTHTQDKEISVHEDEIVTRAKIDPADFKPLYEKYYKPIFVYILHRCGDKAVTADLVSQVFLKALVNLNQYTPRGLPISSWLYRIATNECNEFYRKTKRARMVVLEDTVAEALSEEIFPVDPLDDLKNTLPAIIEQLDLDEIQLVELRFMESRPFREVADILGITENYAKVKTYRILDKMKKIFLQKR